MPSNPTISHLFPVKGLKEKMGVLLMGTLAISLGALIIWYFEGQKGLALETLYGFRFRKRYIFPLPFWCFHLGYALLVSRRKEVFKTHWWMKTLYSGLVLHLALLLTSFLAQDTAAPLQSVFFTFYCKGVASFLLAVICCVSLILLLDTSKEDPVWGGVLVFPFFLPILYPSALTLVILGFSFLLFWKRHSLYRLQLPSVTRACVLLFVVAALFRLAAAWRLSGMGLQTVLTNSDDAISYFKDAGILLKGSQVDGYYSYGTSGAIAFIRWVVGEDIRKVLISLSLLCSTIPVGIYLLARKIFDNKTAFFSGLIVALSQLMIFNSVNITREAIGTLFITWCTFLMVSLSEIKCRKPYFWSLVLGILAGYFATVEVLFRPLFLLFLASYFLFFSPHRRLVKIKLTGLMSVSFLISSYFVQWALTGKTNLLGRDPQAAATMATAYSSYARLLDQNGVNFVSNLLGSFFNLFKAPVENFSLLGMKFLVDFSGFFFESYSGQFDPIVLVRNSDLAANLNVYGYLFAAVGFGVGLLEVIKGNEKTKLRIIPYGLCVLYAGVYIVLFFGATRYRATIQPLLALWIAYGISVFIRWGKTIDPKQVPIG